MNVSKFEKISVTCSAYLEKSLRPLRLERSGRFKKQKLNRKGAKYAKVIMLSPIGGTDEEKTMMEMLNRYKFYL